MLNLKMLTSVTAILLAALLLAGCSTTPNGRVADTSKPMLSVAEESLADCIIDSQMAFRNYLHEHRRRVSINIMRTSISYAELNCQRLAPR